MAGILDNFARPIEERENYQATAAGQQATQAEIDDGVIGDAEPIANLDTGTINEDVNLTSTKRDRELAGKNYTGEVLPTRVDNIHAQYDSPTITAPVQLEQPQRMGFSFYGNTRKVAESPDYVVQAREGVLKAQQEAEAARQRYIDAGLQDNFWRTISEAFYDAQIKGPSQKVTSAIQYYDTVRAEYGTNVSLLQERIKADAALQEAIVEQADYRMANLPRYTTRARTGAEYSKEYTGDDIKYVDATRGAARNSVAMDKDAAKVMKENYDTFIGDINLDELDSREARNLVSSLYELRANGTIDASMGLMALDKVASRPGIFGDDVEVFRQGMIASGINELSANRLAAAYSIPRLRAQLQAMADNKDVKLATTVFESTLSSKDLQDVQAIWRKSEVMRSNQNANSGIAVYSMTERASSSPVRSITERLIDEDKTNLYNTVMFSGAAQDATYAQQRSTEMFKLWAQDKEDTVKALTGQYVLGGYTNVKTDTAMEHIKSDRFDNSMTDPMLQKIAFRVVSDIGEVMGLPSVYEKSQRKQLQELFSKNIERLQNGDKIPETLGTDMVNMMMTQKMLTMFGSYNDIANSSDDMFKKAYEEAYKYVQLQIANSRQTLTMEAGSMQAALTRLGIPRESWKKLGYREVEGNAQAGVPARASITFEGSSLLRAKVRNVVKYAVLSDSMHTNMNYIRNQVLPTMDDVALWRVIAPRANVDTIIRAELMERRRAEALVQEQARQAQIQAAQAQAQANVMGATK